MGLGTQASSRSAEPGGSGPFSADNGVLVFSLYSKMLVVSRALLHRKFLAGLLVALALGWVPGSAEDRHLSKLSPQQLVHEAVENELAANRTAPIHFLFKDERKTVHHSQVRLLVETRDATAGMMVAENGQPLNLEQRKAEEARLESYVRNPEQLNRKRKQEKEDAERTERIMRALPEAFLYQEAGTQTGSATLGRPGAELIRLKFRPNPNYTPPTRVEQVLTGMAGQLLIDPNDKRIAEINGTLEKDVGFGWGILGHLDQGGQFLVQQAVVANHTWDVTRMQLAFTGKILLIKKLNIESTDLFFDFHPVPSDLTFSQGVELLEKQASEPQSASTPVPKPNQKSHSAQAPKAEDEAQKLCCHR